MPEGDQPGQPVDVDYVRLAVGQDGLYDRDEEPRDLLRAADLARGRLRLAAAVAMPYDIGRPDLPQRLAAAAYKGGPDALRRGLLPPIQAARKRSVAACTRSGSG